MRCISSHLAIAFTLAVALAVSALSGASAALAIEPGSGGSAGAPATADTSASTVPDIAGPYRVAGRNRNGTAYSGTAEIAVTGESVRVSWLIAKKQTFRGSGSFRDGRLVVDFGDKHPVIYVPQPDGSLVGTWDDGRASETLTPAAGGRGLPPGKPGPAKRTFDAAS
ncbi:MAG: hypothetical protein NW205_01705 [Hyphomicrobiaceae bacterium]|nr:hypothetical protein [Hyphomicrobiaceae bacterium]